MSDRSKIDDILIERGKLEGAIPADSDLNLTNKVIQEYAPEIQFIYQIRDDESEEQQIKTGRLHENRILGIFLKFYLENKMKSTTREIETEYKKYFKEIARSTTSTYLNMLKKESTLYTERDGRIVHYIFRESPPKGMEPFWFTRMFCIVPAYFQRGYDFSILYVNAEKYMRPYINKYGDVDKEILIRNFKFITGLIILNIFKNRSSKCIDCQFSKREVYKKLEEKIGLALKDRSDVLPPEILEQLVEKYSEISVFNGIDIKGDSMDKIVQDILRSADIYKKDLDFQIMVSTRRTASRLDHKKVLEPHEVQDKFVF